MTNQYVGSQEHFEDNVNAHHDQLELENRQYDNRDMPDDREQPFEKKEKPTMEKYGWHTQNGLDDDPTGWMFEGGEEAYYQALKEYENQ